MWFFDKNTKKIDAEHLRKMAAGRNALLDAAANTALEAESVTAKLKEINTQN